MKKIFSLVCGFAATLMLASCSSDEPSNPNKNEVTDPDADFYASLTITLPTGSRAAGENAGEEFGKDPENNVGKILVVLATKDEATGEYKFLTAAQSDAMPTHDSSLPDNKLKFTLNFRSSALDPNAPLTPGSTLPGAKVYVFAYCNPTVNVVDRFTGNSSTFPIDNTFGQISGNNSLTHEIWTDNSFLMTNCEISQPVTIPSRTDLVNNHNVPEKAFNLGNVNVKRVCARFDYATTGDQKFVVKSLDGTDENMGTIELLDMALFNIQRHFFHLPRTAATWNWSTSSDPKDYTLCGDLEGYVMSYNTGSFKNTELVDDYTKYFAANIINNSLGTDAKDGDDLDWVSIRKADWDKKDADTDGGWTNTNNTDYRIWRYCTENTIPARTDASATYSQRYGITTGVVFKALFEPTNKTVWDGDVIYVYNNIVYGDFIELRDYVAKNPTSNVAAAFEKVTRFQQALDVDDEDIDLKVNLLESPNPLSDAARQGFKAYEAASDGKYYMYFFYYNRHKSNGNNSSLGTDEFGVVRNNVYKLQVTGIRSLGEPKAPTNPETPDEQENAYFTVSCVVMPWTVRINNIEF